jgi:adenylate kinase family enzyme
MRVHNIVVAGKSGAGKQPRNDVLLAKYNLTQLSTGNIFREYMGAYGKIREHVRTDGLFVEGCFAPDVDIRRALSGAAQAAGVPVESAVLGFKAAQYVDLGKFVPDEITNALLAAAFRKNKGRGFVLDGYPRTPEQAEFLLNLAKESQTRIDLILLVENDDETIIKRTVGRRICSDRTCGKVFHLKHKPPRADGTCVVCGAKVIHRSDDTEDKIRTRLKEYVDKALPAIARLVAANIPFVTVPGNLPEFTDAAVQKSVLDAIRMVLGD